MIMPLKAGHPGPRPAVQACRHRGNITRDKKRRGGGAGKFTPLIHVKYKYVSRLLIQLCFIKQNIAQMAGDY
jgi:hypothetical protein